MREGQGREVKRVVVLGVDQPTDCLAASADGALTSRVNHRKRALRTTRQAGWEGCFMQLEYEEAAILLCNVSGACYSFLPFSPHY